MVMFVYFTDTAFSPPALCTSHVTTYCPIAMRILGIATIAGKLSHQVLLDNVSSCNNHFLSRHQSVLVANRYLFLETVGLQVILVNVLAHSNVDLYVWY